MHPEVLDSKQARLLPLIGRFADSFYLAGGTAMALQVGHRRSIDFDLFSPAEIDADKLIRALTKQGHAIDHVFTESGDELTLAVDGVRLSFVFYPFTIRHEVWYDRIISMPDLPTLAAMKAYALGRRAKWKDYVDLYEIFVNHASFDAVVSQAASIFQGAFNQRLFREQLCYFEDIDFTEEIDYLHPNPAGKARIKAALTRIATT